MPNIAVQQATTAAPANRAVWRAGRRSSVAPRAAARWRSEAAVQVADKPPAAASSNGNGNGNGHNGNGHSNGNGATAAAAAEAPPVALMNDQFASALSAALSRSGGGGGLLNGAADGSGEQGAE